MGNRWVLSETELYSQKHRAAVCDIRVQSWIEGFSGGHKDAVRDRGVHPEKEGCS